MSDKEWLRRLLTPATAKPPLAAPERQQPARQDVRDNAAARGASASVSYDTPPPAPAPPAQPAAPAPTASAASPRAENVGPGRQREVKPSERLAALRSALTVRARDMADAMPRHASEEARAELAALWQRIEALGNTLETIQRGEDTDARLNRQRDAGRERERER